jgi:hypothetical protein
VERYDLPKKIDGILALMREVMLRGGVQRIEFDVDHPVRVFREVASLDKDENQIMLEHDVGLEGQLRQIEIVEYYSEEASSFQVVVDMMQLVQAESLKPVCWVVGPRGRDTLIEWMEWVERGVPADSCTLVGVEVRQIQDLPSDVLMLCASQYTTADDTEITMAVKASMEFYDEQPASDPSGETDDRVRSSSGKRPTAASALALAAGRIHKESG